MKTKKIYTNGNIIKKEPGIKKEEYVPCLLFVTEEVVHDGIRISIKGRENPLPFKEATIHNGSIFVETWLKKEGWCKIGINYIKD